MEEHRHAGLTLTILVLLCVLGGCFGIRTMTADLPDEPLISQPAKCHMRTIDPGTTVRPSDVVVSVFNAGRRSGQASRTMIQLQARGFVAGDSDNAPAGTQVSRVQVWSDDPTNPAVKLVAAQFGPGTRIEPSKPQIGAGVVVVVGDDFRRLARDVITQAAAVSETQVCSPPL